MTKVRFYSNYSSLDAALANLCIARTVYCLEFLVKYKINTEQELLDLHLLCVCV